MQKWAYLFVTCEARHGVWRPRWQDLEELQGWRSLNIRDYSNMLGDAGWELVSVLRDEHNYQLVFKRPKTPEHY